MTPVIRTYTTTKELIEILGPWRQLVDHAADPNPFYEDWFLLPSLKHFARDAKLVFWTAWDGDSLIALVPLSAERGGARTPFSVTRLWRHVHCYLCSPLVREGDARRVVKAFLAWFASQNALPKALDLSWLAEDSSFVSELRKALSGFHWATLESSYQRCLYLKETDAETHLQRALSGKHRRDYKRLEKRLQEMGTYQYVGAHGADTEYPVAIDRWISDFLDLEASGWKGRSQTAMKCDPAHKAFFEEVVLGAHANGKLMRMDATLNGSPIASKCTFASGGVGFSFKIAFDEQYSKYRPGLLLELEHVHEIYRRPLRAVDSCASPEHSMLDRLSVHRRQISSIMAAPRWSVAGLWVAALPLLRATLDLLGTLGQRMRRRSVSGPMTPSAESA